MNDDLVVALEAAVLAADRLTQKWFYRAVAAEKDGDHESASEYRKERDKYSIMHGNIRRMLITQKEGSE